MRENRTSGSMRGCWRSSTVGLVRHRQTKGAGTDRPGLPSGGQCSTLPHYIISSKSVGRPALLGIRPQNVYRAAAQGQAAGAEWERLLTTC
jgi:hypothetical protein